MLNQKCAQRHFRRDTVGFGSKDLFDFYLASVIGTSLHVSVSKTLARRHPWIEQHASSSFHSALSAMLSPHGCVTIDCSAHIVAGLNFIYWYDHNVAMGIVGPWLHVKFDISLATRI